MASQVDKVVPKHRISFVRMPAEVLLKGPEVPLAHPHLRGTSISHYTLTEKLAPNVTAMKYPSRKHGTLCQESDVRAV